MRYAGMNDRRYRWITNCLNEYIREWTINRKLKTAPLSQNAIYMQVSVKNLETNKRSQAYNADKTRVQLQPWTVNILTSVGTFTYPAKRKFLDSFNLHELV